MISINGEQSRIMAVMRHRRKVFGGVLPRFEWQMEEVSSPVAKERKQG